MEVKAGERAGKSLEAAEVGKVGSTPLQGSAGQKKQPPFESTAEVSAL